VGEDCAVVKTKEACLVLKTDPVTFVTSRAGFYALHINANDVASMGARPLWFQSVILCPVGTTEALVRELFAQIDEAAKGMGIAVVGGHTEVTPAVDRVVIVGCMQGLVLKERIVTSSGIKPGDMVVMTKFAGLEGTGVLLQERPQEARKLLGDKGLQKSERLLDELGISIVDEALLASEVGVHAMHDVTEGGVATALHELALASRVRIQVRPDHVPVLKATRVLCQHFGIDPIGLLGSGALLIALPKEDWPKLKEAFDAKGFSCTPIGEAMEGDRVVGFDGQKTFTLPLYEQDELTKVL
jgi:hydrogenase maturation factor